MKGLLYKDYINGRGFIAIVIFYLCYVGSMISVISYEFTNGKDIVEQIEVITECFSMMVACVFVACLIPMSMSTTLCNTDNKTKWNDYALALPGGYKLVVAEKYVIVLIGHLISAVSSLVITYCIKTIFVLDVEGFKLETDIFIMLMLVLVGISLLFNAILLPFIVRNKSWWIDILFVAVVVIVFYAGFAYLALGDISFFQQENLVQKMLEWVSKNETSLWIICGAVTGIGLVSQLISYFVTTKTYLNYS